MDVQFNIEAEALRLGFDLCGVAQSQPLTAQKEQFDNWLAAGCDGGLNYMRRHTEKRFNPAELFPGAQSVIVCAMSYHRPPSSGEVAARIASYALGKDYHLILKEKLTLLLDTLRQFYPQAQGRVFVDTAPIAEKSWAVAAGLGWIGRNSLLCHPRLGSFLVLGVIVTDLALPSSDPCSLNQKGCGDCRACLHACPVGAIREDRTIDASRCTSRKTIEQAPESEGDLHGWLFGCDRCQQVCPHNAKAPYLAHPEFTPERRIETLTRQEFLALSSEDFKTLFGETPLMRCGQERIIRRLLAEEDEH